MGVKKTQYDIFGKNTKAEKGIGSFSTDSYDFVEETPFLYYNKFVHWYSVVRPLEERKDFMSLVYNISFETASAFFLVFLFICMKLQYSTNSEINREFQKLTLLVLCADVLDVITAVTISYAGMIPEFINIFLNTVYFILDAFVGYQFMYYSRLCVDRNRKNSFMLRLNRILLCIYLVILGLNAFNGCIFSIGPEGEYLHGILYLLVYIVPYYFIGCSAYVLLYNLEKFQVWQKVSIFLYLILVFVGPVLQLIFFPDVLLGLFSSTLALMMILFTMETPDYQKLMKTIDELRETKEAAEKAQKAAQEANQAKTDFLANMSHEVRTPINAILGYNEMIMKETKESQTTEYAINVQAAGRALLSIVNDILDFTNIDKGELKLEENPYFVPSLIQDIMTYAECNAGKKNLEMRFDIDENLPRQFSGDLVRLMQIYNNLISNAIKYTKEGFVEIYIGWEKVSDTSGIVETKVKDSGIGMREEDIQRISESFSRFDLHKNRNVQGVGLGLTIVTRLLELMDSSLHIESEYGRGSTFSFKIQQEIVEERPIGKIDRISQNTLFPKHEEDGFTASEACILTVDDNVMNLDVFCRILKDTHIQIDTANNGAEALELLEKNTYHIVFLDHMMPVMDGIETLKRIKEKGLCKNTPVIVLTANAVAGEKQMYLDIGFDDYLSKPVVSKQLREMVYSLLPKEMILENAKESVLTKDSTGDTENADKEEAGLIERLDTLLDTTVGLSYCCNDEEFYQEMLTTYLKNQKYDEIMKCYQEEDWENYRILVHALKSTSLSIGAEGLSEQAKALEMAAKETDISYIKENHEKVLNDYQNLLSGLDEIIGEDKKERIVIENEENFPSVLVVDDDAMNLQVAAKMLVDGFKVSCVDSGKKALDFLKSQIPDLILLDIHMPDMIGFEVLEQMQADSSYREIPVIFLTADDDRDTEVKGFLAGALDFIKKPFVKDIMLQRVNRILELNRLQKNLQHEVEKQTKVAEERRRKVERLSVQIMSALADTIDAKDAYTNGHSARVAEYAKEIAKRIGKNEQEQEDIYYVGLLHDIGKIGIPDEIINKTSRLNDEEYEKIKMHPVIGSNILKNISEMKDIGVGARWHHERYDGKGYPDRLAGEDIPEVARIIGVADAYDAMTSKRSYRNVMPQEVVRGEIEKGKGTQFDPHFADVMLEMIDEDKEYQMHEM